MLAVNTALRSALCLSLAAALAAPALAQRTGSKTSKATTDTTRPVLSLPASRVVEATSEAGRTVWFRASAVDNVDGTVSVTCDPARGTVFSLGSKAVVCGARDRAGNSVTGSFTVSVLDTVAPAIGLPGTISTTAPSPAGVPVSFSVSASDRVDAKAAALCTPASGSVFAPGTTSVNCGAADFSGNRSSGRFDVTVSVAAPVDVASSTSTTTTQVAVSGSAALSWSSPTTRSNGQPLSMSELAGYEIYMLAESTGVSSVITVSDPFSTSRSIDGLTPDIYHFAISAIDSSGLVSALSTLVSKTVP